MCGIWAYIGNVARLQTDTAKQCTETILSRGPESISTAVFANGNAHFGFTRLAINGLHPSGMQPMTYGRTHWICNGEIYNWKELRDRHQLECASESDCSVIGPLWEKFRHRPTQFFQALDGVFSIIICDEETGSVIVGRDPYGVRPLFYRQFADAIAFGSEMKSLVPIPAVVGDAQVSIFQPGSWAKISLGDGTICESGQYHTVPWIKNMCYAPGSGKFTEASSALRSSLIHAVRKRVLTTERPIAALLSGGIDSSLIASLVQQELRRMGRPPLETYSIGFEGSSDLHYAQIVADHIGSNHHSIIVTPDDFFRAIPEVIRDIESYDITTVRASVGNWMVCREIAKRSQAKVIFNGDGSDEVFGSYLYFFRAPDDEAFEAESARLLTDMHMYDVLRSDRSISSHGLEARTPFLDKQFVACARSIATVWRRPRRMTDGCMERSCGEDVVEPRCEKWILRMAFENTCVLPLSVLWRQKEAFSDGVSGPTKAWYQEIQERVPADQLSTRTYEHLAPQTAEARYYRDIFDRIYGAVCEKTIPYFWMPKWSGETTDPSARTLSLY
jgi:asparagine synthase (glutamine-hydrolysing)